MTKDKNATVIIEDKYCGSLSSPYSNRAFPIDPATCNPSSKEKIESHEVYNETYP